MAQYGQSRDPAPSAVTGSKGIGGPTYEPMASLPAGISSTWMVPKELGEVYGEQARGETGLNSMREGLQPHAFGAAYGGPEFQRFQQMYGQDPRIQQAQRGYDWNLNRLNRAATDLTNQTGQFGRYAQNFLGQDIGSMRRQAYGQGPSYAEKYGAAQRQQAQGDIARQAAMGARGGMDPASRRAAIMQSSNVGANMASQIAAARVQERQQAMQQYLQARQAQLQARQAGLGAQQQAAAFRGQVADARGAALDRADRGFMGSTDLAGKTYTATTTARQNIGALPGG